jgi:patatin-like phospholipase/acyl hydrolase
LALNHSVGELIDLCINVANESFVRRGSAPLRWLGGAIVPKFDDETLLRVLRKEFGTDTLGSDRIRCGLAIVAKRLDTGSVWLFHNHPNGPYFRAGDRAGDYTANCDIALVQLLRASTAAPSYFGPEYLEVAPGVTGLFVDGGVSPHNNPSLLLFMLATLQGYGFRWPMGDDRLMLVSIGTRPRFGARPLRRENLLSCSRASHSYR